jgi:hypothetical protein
MLTDYERENITALITVIEREDEVQCYMGDWLRVDGLMEQLKPVSERGRPGCGTVGCLAGTAVVNLLPSLLMPGTGLNTGARRSYEHVLVPYEWALSNNVEIREVVDGVEFELTPGTMTKTTAARVPISHAAQVLLGETVARAFYLTDAPHDEQMSDKEWMLMVLRLALRGRLDEYIDDRIYEN